MVQLYDYDLVFQVITHINLWR